MHGRIGNGPPDPLAFSFVCPLCRGPLQESGAAYRCSRDEQSYPCLDGIWRFLPPPLAGAYAPFVATYELVRRAEGWQQAGPDYYRSLPFTYGRQLSPEIWRIRAGSYRVLMDRVVSRLAARLGRPLQILDLGAGTGWLSYRLAQAGHHSAAVDLLTNDWDGLGAWRNFADHPLFVPVQAAFDHLPFPDGAVDMAIFNGSIHYARDYSGPLGEALRALRPGGQVVIMDSPFYGAAASGVQMVSEKEEAFGRDYGVDITALPAEDFLTPARLDQLGEQLQMTWRLLRPYRGLRWTMRWWRHRLRGRREAARFPLIVGQR
jgi:SAM-dependent methyltransferase